MTGSDEGEPAGIAFNVRTLGPDGEFTLRSSAEVAQKLQASLGGRPLTILALSSSHTTRATLESTVDALRRRGIALDYAAIPASYPLPGAFDFDPGAQRSLFEYAAGCAAEGRLWIHVNSSVGLAVAERASTSAPMCPADDTFIVSFAARGN